MLLHQPSRIDRATPESLAALPEPHIAAVLILFSTTKWQFRPSKDVCKEKLKKPRPYWLVTRSHDPHQEWRTPQTRLVQISSEATFRIGCQKCRHHSSSPQHPPRTASRGNYNREIGVGSTRECLWQPLSP